MTTISIRGSAAHVWSLLDLADVESLAAAWLRSSVVLKELASLCPPDTAPHEIRICREAIVLVRTHLHLALESKFPGVLLWWSEHLEEDEFEWAYRAAASPDLARQMAEEKEDLDSGLRRAHEEAGLPYDQDRIDGRPARTDDPLLIAVLDYFLKGSDVGGSDPAS